MNVILTNEEVQVVASLVVSLVLESAPISEAGKETLRRWRKVYDVGGAELNAFALRFNEALGNHIDQRTTRMVQRRGQVRVSTIVEH
ncbi:MAG: hypothetical protein EXR65_00590 [Dehalococcoidia bacterium]|nr:hypothetical protein [Dehalococcoidia bacterium]